MAGAGSAKELSEADYKFTLHFAGLYIIPSSTALLAFRVIISCPVALKLQALVSL